MTNKILEHKQMDVEEELRESKNQLEKSMADIAFLYRTLNSISSLSKKKDILNLTSKEIARAFNAEIVCILLLNKNTNEIVISCYGINKEKYDKISGFLSENRGKIKSTGMQKVIQHLLKHYKIKSAMNVSFEAKNSIFGAIQIFRLYSQEFTPEERQLVSIVSSHISTAIENIEFYNKLNRYIGEIETKNKELEKFNKLSVGRELQMIELKNKIKRLKRKG